MRPTHSPPAFCFCFRRTLLSLPLHPAPLPNLEAARTNSRGLRVSSSTLLPASCTRPSFSRQKSWTAPAAPPSVRGHYIVKKSYEKVCPLDKSPFFDIPITVVKKKLFLFFSSRMDSSVLFPFGDERLFVDHATVSLSLVSRNQMISFYFFLSCRFVPTLRLFYFPPCTTPHLMVVCSWLILCAALDHHPSSEASECALVVTGAYDRRLRLWDVTPATVAAAGGRAKILGTLSSKVGPLTLRASERQIFFHLAKRFHVLQA